MRARRVQVEAAISAAGNEVKRLEERYGVSFSTFESEILPDATSQQAHEDYNDWYFWTESRIEHQKFLNTLRGLDLHAYRV